MCGVRVLLVDDHTLVRSGIRSLLSLDPLIEVVGEASTGEQAVELTDRLSPSVVLMDLFMDGTMSGLDATRRIAERNPESRILVLTMVSSEEFYEPVLEAGASGYILKECEAQELLFAVHAVARGEVYVTPSVASSVVRSHVDQKGNGDGTAELTSSQRKVIALAATGYTNREIATQLNFSQKTVEKYRASAMKTLGLHSRAELTRFAASHGLIRFGEINPPS